MRLAWIPFTLAGAPIATVLLCYSLSASANLIPACIPLTEGCTTISSAGRYGVAYYLFKAGMIPSAALMGLFWALCRRWYISLDCPDSMGLRMMVWLGVISAVFLILYAVALGSFGEFYKFMRRAGITVHFSFAYLAQVLLLNRLWYDHRRDLLQQLPGYIPVAMLTISLFMFALGLYSIPVGELIPDPDDVVINMIEWNFALLLFSWYLVAGIAWRRTRFHSLKTGRPE
jgi:hypothetical protein